MKNEIRPFLCDYRDCDKYVGCILNYNSLHELPEIEGVYIIASEEQIFIYLNRESPIIYISKSVNLKTRLLEHHRHCEDLFNRTKVELVDDWYYSRYQYIHKFGG